MTEDEEDEVDVSPEGECYLLTRIPYELRSIIYQHILSFSRPLKHRQIVAGSPNTAILRANRQIHSEALAVFYDSNNIITTRNDFCHYTPSDLRAALHHKNLLRHLLVKNFSQSIKCSSYSGGNHAYLAGCCPVCQPTATGFIAALQDLPRLQSVVIDYRSHRAEFEYMKTVIRRNGVLPTLAQSRSLKCVGMGRYRLRGSSIRENLDVVFSDLPFHTLWTMFENMESLMSVYGIPSEPQILAGLREDVDRELTDKLFFLFCARHSVLWGSLFVKIADLWAALDSTVAQGSDAGSEMEHLTEEVFNFCTRHSTEDARMQLGLLRIEEARLTDIMRM